MSVSTPTLAHAAPDLSPDLPTTSRRRRALAAEARTAWSPDHPVLTTEGRRLLQDRADERAGVLPALRTPINDPECDGHSDAVYTHALG